MGVFASQLAKISRKYLNLQQREKKMKIVCKNPFPKWSPENDSLKYFFHRCFFTGKIKTNHVGFGYNNISISQLYWYVC
jgi:hypothetical protein